MSHFYDPDCLCLDCQQGWTPETPDRFADRIDGALDLAFRYGSIDGDHHKMWVIDQMVRVLTGVHYKSWIKGVKSGEDGPDTYEWDEGIAP